MPKRKTFREKVAFVINHLATEAIIALLIVVSVSLLLVEAALGASHPWFRAIALTNDSITFLFIIELSIRFAVEDRKSRFFRKYWIDILAVIPFLRPFRVLRALRLLRVFKFGMLLARDLGLFHRTMRVIRFEYLFVLLSVVVTVIIGTLALLLTESHVNPEIGEFEDALWYTLLSLVASEPILSDPTTRSGRAITLVLMLGGMTLFAIFTGTVCVVMIDSLRKLKLRHRDMDEIKDHIVICGWNPAAELILQQLLDDRAIRNIVVICEEEIDDKHPIFVDNSHRIYALQGDYTKVTVLEEAGVRRARHAILIADQTRESRTYQDRDARTVLAAMLIEKLNPDIYTTVQLLNRDNETSLRELGVEEIIVSDEYVGSIMASVVRSRGVVSVLDELLTARRGNEFFKSKAPKKLIGGTFGEAVTVMKRDYEAVLFAIHTATGIHVNPDSSQVLEPGDRILYASRQALEED